MRSETPLLVQASVREAKGKARQGQISRSCMYQSPNPRWLQVAERCAAIR